MEGRINTEIELDDGSKFLVSTYLGRGSFGEVYLAKNVVSEEFVAVKFLPKGRVNDASSKAMSNEMNLAPRIKHPNVIQVLKVNSEPDNPYIVMEYAPGGTLSQSLEKHKKANEQISIRKAAEMMIDIAQGAMAINKVLIHRDIKPDNILIDGSRLRISDFGISKVIDEKTRLSTFKGGQHVFYMAPEGWRHDTNTHKLDVYSVGLLFYEILLLEHPLKRFVSKLDSSNDWEQAHLFSICEDVRRSRNEVSSSWAHLLSRMTSKRANDRPEWDEIVGILDKSAELHREAEESISSILTNAVDAAVQTRQQRESRKLEEEKKKLKKQRNSAFISLLVNNLGNACTALSVRTIVNVSLKN